MYMCFLHDDICTNGVEQATHHDIMSQCRPCVLTGLGILQHPYSEMCQHVTIDLRYDGR